MEVRQHNGQPDAGHAVLDPCVATDLPHVLKGWRERAGHKITHAAAQLGVAAATWGHWEAGKRFPNAANLSLLSRYTGHSIPELLCANAHRCPYQAIRRAGEDSYSM